MCNTALSLKVLYFLKTIITFIDFADTSKAITTKVYLSCEFQENQINDLGMASNALPEQRQLV